MIQWFERFGRIQSFIKKSPNNTNPRYLGQIIYENVEKCPSSSKCD